MTIVATRRRRRLDLIVASLCAVAIVVVVVVARSPSRLRHNRRLRRPLSNVVKKLVRV
jgi:hypothetical protein